MRLTRGRKAALIIGITLAASSGVIVASSLDSADPAGSVAAAPASPSADSSDTLPTSPGATPSTGPGAVTPSRTPTTAKTASGPRTDRRYETCAQVTEAGLGPYKKDRDPEYRWYVDGDGDGWVCERPPNVPPAPVHYRNCAEVRAAGAAPLHRGEPGYGRHLDRDGDGVACD
jgi:hypothetical protein